MKYSFIIPCYNSEKSIENVVNEIQTVMENMDVSMYEIILVNDCSPDNVWDVILNLSQNNSKIKGVSLARNFGQHSALMAGYSYCSGEYVVSLDDDGQSPVNELYLLMAEFEKGYDVVYAAYEETKRSFFRKLGSHIARKMGQIMIGFPKDFRGSSFFVAKYFVIKEMLKYENAYSYVPGLVLRTTKSIIDVPTHQRERMTGKSGYSLTKLFSLWLNGFTAFSIKPLEVGFLAGAVTAGVGFLYALWIVIRFLVFRNTMVGWSSTICIMLIIGGLNLIMLGLIGEYIGRIYISINKAPQYVIKDATWFDHVR